MTSELTAREREVARLVGSGQRIRDLAQQLGVVPKTIEMHLYKAQRKLGARNRRELLLMVQTA